MQETTHFIFRAMPLNGKNLHTVEMRLGVDISLRYPDYEGDRIPKDALLNKTLNGLRASLF